MNGTSSLTDFKKLLIVSDIRCPIWQFYPFYQGNVYKCF